MHSKEDAEKLVHEDWKESKKVVTGEEGRDWKFEPDFSADLERLKLPVEYDMGVTAFQETMEPTEVYSFDDLQEFPAVELLDFEVMKYEPLNVPAYFNYFPIENTKPLRPGAEYEYSTRGERGDPQLGDRAAADKFASTPATMGAPLNYSRERLVLPNTFLRVYTRPLGFCETDVESALQPGVRNPVEVQDEISLNHKFADKSKVLLGKYLPGNVGTRIARRLQSRISDLFVPPLAVTECTRQHESRLRDADQHRAAGKSNGGRRQT